MRLVQHRDRPLPQAGRGRGDRVGRCRAMRPPIPAPASRAKRRWRAFTCATRMGGSYPARRASLWSGVVCNSWRWAARLARLPGVTPLLEFLTVIPAVSPALVALGQAAFGSRVFGAVSVQPSLFEPPNAPTQPTAAIHPATVTRSQPSTRSSQRGRQGVGLPARRSHGASARPSRPGWRSRECLSRTCR